MKRLELKKTLQSVPLRVKVSTKAVGRVFLNPAYVLIAFVGSFVSSTLVASAINLSFYRYIIFELNVSIGTKLSLFWNNYLDLFSTYNEDFQRVYIAFDSWQEVGTVVFALLFGINIALLIFVLKNQGFKDIPKKSSLGGTVVAVLAGGCVACGTSLLAPIAVTLGATSGAFLRDLSNWLNWIGSVLIIYSIYKLGLLAATAWSKKRRQRAEEPSSETS